MANASDISSFPRRTVGREWLDVYVIIPIGATGAVGTLQSEHPDITITRTGVGAYSVVAPVALNYFIDFMLVQADATPTSNTFGVTALAPTSGTFSFVCYTNLTAAELESGSTLVLRIAMRHRAAVGS